MKHKTPDQPVFGIFLYGLDDSISIQNDLNEKYVDVVLPINSSNINNFECAFWLNRTWSTDNCQKISNKNRILHCKCTGIGYYRAVVIENEEITTTSEMVTLTTLSNLTTEIYSTTPEAVSENKSTKVIFYEKPKTIIFNEELKLKENTTTSINSGI